MAGRIGALFFATGFVSVVRAQSSLRAGAARISAEELELQLHSELTSLLGKGDPAGAARLARLQANMGPLYSALPKGTDGKLDQGAARYALHRFFSRQHGWHVWGLEAIGGEKWGDASSTAMLEDRIPSYVLQLFEKQHGGRIGLRDLAVLAATLEDLVHSEAIQLLSVAYEAQSLREDVYIADELRDKVVATYLLFHIMPNPKYANLSTDRLNTILSQVPKFYTGWEDTVMWVKDVEGTVDYRDFSRCNPFVHKETATHGFESLVQVVEGIGEHYGQYQDLECQTMKSTLLDLSDGAGRVRLSKFYSAAYENRSQHFSENPDYLRHLGVLDETDPSQPSVIVTNYMYARANCLASSSFYSICCIDECASLMSQIESSIAEPVADPSTIAGLVSRMSTDTVVGPRNLSVALRSRLDHIADRHGGRIPLYGRLFAQWMHHAFPNECAYPQTPGSLASPLTPQQWMHAVPDQKRRLKATQEEMQSIIDTAVSFNVSIEHGVDVELTLPWDEAEELAIGSHTADPKAAISSWLRLAVLALAVSSASIGLLKMLSAAPAATLPTYSKGSKRGFWSALFAQKSQLV